MQAQFEIHLTKKDQIHRTGTEKSSKICAQQLQTEHQAVSQIW